MAQGRNLVRYLSGRCTQGSADAFVQASISTGIVAEDGVGLEIVALEFTFNGLIEAIAADSNIVWSLTRDTQTAVIGLNNTDCIIYDGIMVGLVTSGMFSSPVRRAYSDIQGLFIVEPTIYFQLDSNGTGITNQMDVRIYYKEVALSEVDILRILQNA